MELAENVKAKRSTFLKPESFDSKFGDKAYLITENSKSRLRSYLTTFCYVIFCGLLLLFGGGSFFIYESTVIEDLPETEGKSPTGRSASQDTLLLRKKAEYAQEFQTVAFVFIGVGAVMLVVGAPLATQFYRRYKVAKDTERSPILDPVDKKEKKSKIYNPPDSNQQKDDSSKKSSKKKKNYKGKRKSGWMYRSRKSISKEGFRFAAHRHPSMNQITIDGAGFFDRRSSDNSSDGSSYEEISEVNSPKHTKKKTNFRKMLKNIFGVSVKTGSPDQVEGSNGDNPVMPPFMASTEESPSTSAQYSHSHQGIDPDISRHLYNDNLAFESENAIAPIASDGLYNLGQ